MNLPQHLMRNLTWHLLIADLVGRNDLNPPLGESRPCPTKSSPFSLSTVLTVCLNVSAPRVASSRSQSRPLESAV